MAFSFNGTTPTAINFNGSPVYTLICNGVTVWSAAVTATYYVDSGTSYQESVVYGNSVLSPKTFTPSKSGYTFVGWRENSTASSSVLTSKTMGTTPISLYAVFKRDLTLTYYNNSTTSAKKTGTQYYNNGNTSNPSWTMTQADKSGWSKRGWSTSNTAKGTINYNNGASISISSNTTIYGCYSKTCVLTAKSYNKSETVNGTAYYNSSGDVYNASATTPTGATYSGWTWRGWGTGTASNASVAYANGATAWFGTSDATIYGLYEKTVTLTYNGNGATGGSTSSQSATRYYNASGQASNASFTLRSNGFSRTDYNFTAWNLGGTNYAAGATVALTDSATAYAMWRAATKTVTPVNTRTPDDSYYHALDVDRCVLVYGPVNAADYASVTINIKSCWAEANFEGSTAFIGFGSWTKSSPPPTTGSSSTDYTQFTARTYIAEGSRAWVSPDGEGEQEFNQYGTTFTHTFKETSGNVYLFMGCVGMDGGTSGYQDIKITSPITLNPR